MMTTTPPHTHLAGILLQQLNTLVTVLLGFDPE